MKSINNKDIAIIGMATNFPRSKNLKEYWNVLKNGVDCIREFPKNRKKDIEDYINFLGKEDEGFIKAGFLENIDMFDNKFFNLTPKEAVLMSPVQRMFLEIAYKGFYDAGYNKEKLNGSKTGVYVGYIGDYEGYIYRNMLQNLTDDFSSIAMSGNLSSIISGRVSYSFNLKGPSILIDTACSSSLVALHNGCRDIHDGICDMALVGGIKICMLPTNSSEKIGIEAMDGKTKAFDEKADGTGIGEGAGAIVIKSLSKAERDGDYIYAVIKGSAINQDGASVGMTAPNPSAQRDVYLQAWKNARINPEDISYIEAHGTGTKLGDPIEIDGLTQAFRKYTDKTQFCAIGSVKTNIGHLYEASGIASIIKTVLALNFGKIPPSLHFDMPNHKIDFIHSPFYVAGEIKDWKNNGKTKLAGVSSFGFSGTNCHVVLEEYNGKVKPYMESIEERLEKSTEEIFDNKRYWFETKYILSSSERKSVVANKKEDFKLIGKEIFSEYEEKIGKLWSKHMGYTEINIFDNFFELGGDSIIATKIVCDIQKEISSGIKNSDIFSFPTIESLSKHLESFQGNNKTEIEILPKKSYYKASAEQQRLYIVYQIENKDGTYNMPFVAEFNKKIDKDKVEKAVNAIIQRHETLRTRFFEKNGVIYQEIKEFPNWKLNHENIREKDLQKKIKECQKSFDLGVPPLIRVKLFDTEKRSVIFVDMHHIISDGTSMGIFIKELMVYFNGGNMEPLTVQYKDFSVWQEKYLKSETVKKQETFWKSIFKDGIPILYLPEDFKRPSIRTTKGGSYSFKESERVRNLVEALAKEKECTPFIILLSAYYIMLHKLSKQSSIVVGSPVSGRIHYQSIPMIGMFVNMIPFKVDIDKEDTMLQFIEKMKEVVYKAYENQECQFETIASLNVKNRPEGRNPVMDVLFAYQNMELPELVLDNDKAKTYNINSDSKYDLMLEIYNEDKSYNLRFEYYSEIFKEDTIKEFAKLYSDILNKFIENENTTIKEICIDNENNKINDISIDFNF